MPTTGRTAQWIWQRKVDWPSADYPAGNGESRILRHSVTRPDRAPGALTHLATVFALAALVIVSAPAGALDSAKEGNCCCRYYTGFPIGWVETVTDRSICQELPESLCVSPELGCASGLASAEDERASGGARSRVR
jgi:hypothetical protein